MDARHVRLLTVLREWLAEAQAELHAARGQHDQLLAAQVRVQTLVRVLDLVEEIG